MAEGQEAQRQLKAFLLAHIYHEHYRSATSTLEELKPLLPLLAEDGGELVQILGLSPYESAVYRGFIDPEHKMLMNDTPNAISRLFRRRK